jgi:hypothetical protein
MSSLAPIRNISSPPKLKPSLSCANSDAVVGVKGARRARARRSRSNAPLGPRRFARCSRRSSHDRPVFYPELLDRLLLICLHGTLSGPAASPRPNRDACAISMDAPSGSSTSLAPPAPSPAPSRIRTLARHVSPRRRPACFRRPRRGRDHELPERARLRRARDDRAAWVRHRRLRRVLDHERVLGRDVRGHQLPCMRRPVVLRRCRVRYAPLVGSLLVDGAANKHRQPTPSSRACRRSRAR